MMKNFSGGGNCIVPAEFSPAQRLRDVTLHIHIRTGPAAG